MCTVLENYNKAFFYHQDAIVSHISIGVATVMMDFVVPAIKIERALFAVNSPVRHITTTKVFSNCDLRLMNFVWLVARSMQCLRMLRLVEFRNEELRVVRRVLSTSHLLTKVVHELTYPTPRLPTSAHFARDCKQQRHHNHKRIFYNISHNFKIPLDYNSVKLPEDPLNTRKREGGIRG